MIVLRRPRRAKPYFAMSHPPTMMDLMADQLRLLDTGANDYRLDERTKELGRVGVAAARQALAEARRRAA